MNVLFYTDTPSFGGAEKQMALLAKHLKLLGCSVSLACGAYSTLSDKLDDLKTYYKTYHLPILHKHDPRHYTALKKMLQKNSFDLIHIHLWNPGSCRYAFWAAKNAHIPIVTTEHDPFELTGMKGLIKRRCLAKTDQIIAISMDNYRQLVQSDELLKKRINLVHNGIEADMYTDNMDKASIGVKDGEPILTCIAELHPRKGHKHLIRAFKMLQADFPALHLFLVGKGPEESVLKAEAESVTNVHFLGWRNETPQILRASTIFVLPSLREAFGLVLLEAMASGVACVSTNNGGANDILQNGVSGLLVPPANSTALADAIRKLLRNPSLKADIEKAALERVKTQFTADVMAQKTFDVYKKVLNMTF